MTGGARTGRLRARARNLALALAAACLTLPGAAIAQAQEGRGDEPRKPAERIFRYLEQAVHIVPGQGLGRVVIGMPLASVVQAWGAPSQSDRSGFINRESTLLFDAGLNAWIQVRGERAVEEIGIEGRTGFTTTEGVRFGMPRHQVEVIYGEPQVTGEGAYRYPGRGIAFTFRSGTVYQIEVFAPREREE